MKVRCPENLTLRLSSSNIRFAKSIYCRHICLTPVLPTKGGNMETTRLSNKSQIVVPKQVRVTHGNLLSAEKRLKKNIGCSGLSHDNTRLDILFSMVSPWSFICIIYPNCQLQRSDPFNSLHTSLAILTASCSSGASGYPISMHSRRYFFRNGDNPPNFSHCIVWTSSWTMV